MSLTVKLTAGVGTAAGIGTVLVIWFFEGATARSDEWLLAMAILQSLTLLSQIGVEQIAVYSVESKSKENFEHDLFDKLAVWWSAIFGITFAALCVFFSGAIVQIFSPGFDEKSWMNVSHYIFYLSSQIVVAPLAYTCRQLLLLREKLVQSVFIGIFPQIILFFSTLYGLTSGSYEVAAACVALLSAVFFLILLALSAKPFKLINPTPVKRFFIKFVVESFKLRAVNSVHNLLVSMLTNAALSHSVPGSISIFSYAKKAADAVMTTTVSPYLSLYHSQQIISWVKKDRDRYDQNKKILIRKTIPWFLAASLTCTVIISILNYQLPSLFRISLDVLSWPMLIVCAWNFVIFVESIVLPPLLIGKKTSTILAVNALYAAMFCISSSYASNPSVTFVCMLLVAFQIVSAVIFYAISRTYEKGWF